MGASKKSYKYTIRVDGETDKFLTSLSRAVGKDTSELIRTAIDCMRLYYLGEGVKEGRGLEAVRHILESLAARAEILSHTPLKVKSR